MNDMTGNRNISPAGTTAGRKHPHIPGELGIWFFVAGDLAVFTLFFVLIALGNGDQAEVFAQSRKSLELWIGVLNTLLLLTGSWFVATAVERCRISAENGSDPQSRDASRYFALAIVTGVLFVANKSFEWGIKIANGITPATNDFFMYFFVFTGIHLFHVLIGLGVLTAIRQVSRRDRLDARSIRTIESGATFWHLVDLLWVVLFALFYLI